MSELLTRSAFVLSLSVIVLLTETASIQAQGWKPHCIKQGDGQGGWILREAQCQVLRYRERGWTAGFGVAQMGNGEVVLMGVCGPGKSL